MANSIVLVIFTFILYNSIPYHFLQAGVEMQSLGKNNYI